MSEAPTCRKCGKPTKYHSDGKTVVWYVCDRCPDPPNSFTMSFRKKEADEAAVPPA